MEPGVDPGHYSEHRIDEGVALNPYQVFIKTEPQLHEPAFTEPTTQPYGKYGQASTGQNSSHYDQTGHLYGQNIDVNQSTLALFHPDAFGQRNEPQYQNVYIPGQSPNDDKKVQIGNSKTFACDVCHKVFSQKYNLMRHRLLHSKERNFSCDVCAKTFVEKYQLNQHALTHSAKKPYTCNICNKAFIQKYMLRNHMMTHTDDKPFACACGLRFRQIGALNRHRSGKFTKKTFQCDLCMKIFKQKAHLIRHIMFHNGEKQYSCNICNKRFSQQSNLNTHQLIHSFEKRFTCEFCDKSFRQAHHLSRHKKMHLKEIETQMQPVTNYLKVCMEEDKTLGMEPEKSEMNVDNPNAVFIKSEPPDIPSTPFTQEVDMKEEGTQISTNLTPEQNEMSPRKTQGCPLAGAQIELPKEYLLKKEKKYYPCEICRKVFYKPFHLVRHKRSHSGARPFKCELCDKSFFLNYHLRNHMTTHTGLKPFVCNVCNTSFNRKSALARHMQLHLDKNRFSCDFCNRTFSTEPLLVKHQNRLCKKKSELKGKKKKSDTQKPHNLMIEKGAAPDNILRSPGYQKRITQSDNLKIHDQTYSDQQKSINQRIYIINEKINFYICDHCGRHFNYKNLLILHLREKTCEKTSLLPCQYCSALFTEKSLPSHERSHRRKEFPCKICQKSFTSKNTLEEHKNEHDDHNGKKPMHECKICKKLFRKGDLTRHERIHRKEKPFKCDICDKAFTLKGNLVAHQVVHTGPKPYVCPICRESFNNYHHMIMHIRGHRSPIPAIPEHTFAGDSHQPPEQSTIHLSNTVTCTDQASKEQNDKVESIVIKIEPLDLPCNYEDDIVNDEHSTEIIVPEEIPTNINCDFAVFNQNRTEVQDKYRFYCNRCQRGFMHKASLINHLKAEKDCEVARPYNCDVCSKSFSRKNHLVDHKHLHSEERPFICQVCQRSFTQKAHWLRHMLVHTGVKRFHCDVCDKSFSRRSYLTEHSRMHSGEKPFTCYECPKTFFRSSSLAQHIQTHKQHKPYQCSICFRGFSQKIHLQTHLMRHDEANRFACEICQKSFSKNSNLLRHMKTHKRLNPLNLIKTKLEIQENETNVALQTENNAQSVNEINEASQANTNVENMLDTEIIVKIEPEDVMYEEDYIKQEPVDKAESEKTPIYGEYSNEKTVHSRPIHEHGSKIVPDKISDIEKETDIPDDVKGEDIDDRSSASRSGSGHSDNSDYNKTLEQYRELLLNMDQAMLSQQDKDDNFECDRCNRQFKYKQTLFMHIQANKCIAKVKQLNSLNPHEPNYTDKSYQCDECYKYFARSKSLKRHKATHKGIRAYTCNICNNSFTQKSSLIRHAVVHSGEKTFSCQICNKGFGRKSTLNKHMLIHSNERRFPCEHCDKSFVQKVHLQKHQVVHTGERYPCDYCDLSFSQKSSLMRHKTSHNVEKRYMCAVCDKLFTRKTHLIEHEKTHTGEKPFSCDICLMKFTFKSGFRRHKRLVHSLPEDDDFNNDSSSWNEDLTQKTAESKQSLNKTFTEESARLSEDLVPPIVKHFMVGKVTPKVDLFS